MDIDQGPHHNLGLLFDALGTRDQAMTHVWAPTYPGIGEKVTRLGVLDLDPGELRFHLVCPEGVGRPLQADGALRLRV